MRDEAGALFCDICGQPLQRYAVESRGTRGGITSITVCLDRRECLRYRDQGNVEATAKREIERQERISRTRAENATASLEDRLQLALRMLQNG